MSGTAVVPRASARAMHSDSKRPLVSERRADDRNRPAILFDDNLDTLLHFREHSMKIARHLRFAHVDGSHRFPYGCNGTLTVPAGPL